MNSPSGDVTLYPNKHCEDEEHYKKKLHGILLEEKQILNILPWLAERKQKDSLIVSGARRVF